MSKEARIGVGVIGAGTVGGGVIDHLRDSGDEHGMQLRRVAVRNPKKYEHIDAPFTEDVNSIFNDPNINIVVELAGGVDSARDYIFDAINKKKSVVTANKAVVARYSKELFESIRANEVDLGFEASVAGGIPIIETLKAYKGERIDRFIAILNGTSNFILSRIEEGMSFDEAVKLAQDRGFAEANHTLDTGGFDARDKLAILGSLIYNTQFDPEDISCKGILDITPADIDFARKYERDERFAGGYAVKLLAIADRKENGVELRVNPALIRAEHPIASVRDEYNGIYLDGERGPQLFTGKGAGREATSGAVYSDLKRIAKNLRQGVVEDYPTLDEQVDVAGPDEVEGRGYIKTNFQDAPGSAAKGFTILGNHGLSVDDWVQLKEHRFEAEGNPYIPDFVTVKPIARRIAEEALGELEASDRVYGKPVFIPFEDNF